MYIYYSFCTVNMLSSYRESILHHHYLLCGGYYCYNHGTDGQGGGVLFMFVIMFREKWSDVFIPLIVVSQQRRI